MPDPLIPAETPVAPAAQVAETPVAVVEAAPKPFVHTSEAGILDIPEETPVAAVIEEKPAVQVAPAEEVKPAETPAEPVVEAEPATPVSYEFTLPEGVTLDQGNLDAAIESFREFGISPENAQKLLDRHIEAIKTMTEQQAAQQSEQWQRAFLDTRKGWQAEAQADPIIGGSAWKTSVQAAKDVLANTALIPKSDRAAFNDMLRTTGASDHPQMIKFLTRINTFFTEPAAPPPAQTPPRGNGAAAGGSRKSAILTHPTSHNS